MIGRRKLCRPSNFLDKANLDCPRFCTAIEDSAESTLRKSLSRKQSYESRRLELPLPMSNGGRQQLRKGDSWFPWQGERKGSRCGSSSHRLERGAPPRGVFSDHHSSGRPGLGHCGCCGLWRREGAVSRVSSDAHGAGDRHDLPGRGDRRVGDEIHSPRARGHRSAGGTPVTGRSDEGVVLGAHAGIRSFAACPWAAKARTRFVGQDVSIRRFPSFLWNWGALIGQHRS